MDTVYGYIPTVIGMKDSIPMVFGKVGVATPARTAPFCMTANGEMVCPLSDLAETIAYDSVTQSLFDNIGKLENQQCSERKVLTKQSVSSR